MGIFAIQFLMEIVNKPSLHMYWAGYPIFFVWCVVTGLSRLYELSTLLIPTKKIMHLYLSYQHLVNHFWIRSNKLYPKLVCCSVGICFTMERTLEFSHVHSKQEGAIMWRYPCSVKPQQGTCITLQSIQV